MPRRLDVHLVPELAPREAFAGGVAVVIDVLRMSTTFVHAFAAGCERILTTMDPTAAERLAAELPASERLTFGERNGLPLDGFDLGNSPSDFTPARCCGRTAVATTTNGTRALARAALADRTLVGAFVNFSAVCNELVEDDRPIHLLCAGWLGRVSLEDSLCAGALVDRLTARGEFAVNDAARMAWDAFEHHGKLLLDAFELSEAGRHLIGLGMGKDLRSAAAVDRFGIVPQATGDPPEVSVAGVRFEMGLLGDRREARP
jgi:2-phosphosulfolactate phosphatase